MNTFDTPARRRGSDCAKWANLEKDVIPMWVADMDFQSPPPILEAMLKRVQHGYFGYPYTLDLLKETIVAHYETVYHVKVESDWIVWVPSVISGAVNALQMMNGTFMFSTPMYDHIRSLTREANLPVIEVPMKRDDRYHYTMDIAALENAVTPEVKCLILCNPHNPVGRVYEKTELLELLEFCKKHHLLLISDEIHCELILENRHHPFFSISEDAKEFSITLSSAGKTCNIPGLPMGFAIIPNEELRSNFSRRQDGLLPSPNVITLAAYEKAYDGSCTPWKEELKTYLRANRDLAEARLNQIPELKTPHNEGTYLLWIDCSALKLEDPAAFFLEHAHVRVSPGQIYGDKQFVRFNFACPKSQLIDALDRMEAAIQTLRNETLK